jgi:hypothetical protein
MKILIACEFSGRVREAFAKYGHDVWSCDVLSTEIPGNHIQADVLTILDDGWDMMVAFPPCTHLAVSGTKWFKYKVQQQKDAIEFFMKLVNVPIPMIAVENPKSIMSTHYRKPDQIVQPWWFGDSYQKSTCLWLKNLPLLKPTNIVSPGEFVMYGGERLPKWYNDMAKLDRTKNRSRTFLGMAEAMAAQWNKEFKKRDLGLL